MLSLRRMNVRFHLSFREECHLLTYLLTYFPLRPRKLKMNLSCLFLHQLSLSYYAAVLYAALCVLPARLSICLSVWT